MVSAPKTELVTVGATSGSGRMVIPSLGTDKYANGFSVCFGEGMDKKVLKEDNMTAKTIMSRSVALIVGSGCFLFFLGIYIKVTQACVVFKRKMFVQLFAIGFIYNSFDNIIERK